MYIRFYDFYELFTLFCWFCLLSVYCMTRLTGPTSPFLFALNTQSHCAHGFCEPSHTVHFGVTEGAADTRPVHSPVLLLHSLTPVPLTA